MEPKTLMELVGKWRANTAREKATPRSKAFHDIAQALCRVQDDCADELEALVKKADVSIRIQGDIDKCAGWGNQTHTEIRRDILGTVKE